MTRSRFRSFHTAVVTSGLTVAFANVAMGQEEAPPPPVVVETAPPALPPPPSDTGAAARAYVPDSAESTAPEAEEKATPWYDGISVGAFVDAYGAIRSDSNEARNPAGATVANPVGYGHEAYVQASGFALAFAGADLSYSGDKFGATISMRFGPGVNRFYAADQGAFGIDNITQGFLTWKPTDYLTLDLGQFYTIYGAEVTESWRNINYSRGALYYSMQPFWHTGLRANIKLSDTFALNALVVNGVNTAFEGNKSPSLGIQALITPGDYLSLAVGYLGGLNPRDGDDETAVTKNFQDFFDFVGTVTAGDFKLVVNADLNLYKAKYIVAEDGTASGGSSEYWWGVSAMPAYAFTDWFTLGARVEYLEDSANSQLIQPASGKAKLTTLTFTTDFKPIPDSTALILRPEFRYEIAGSDVFNDGSASGFTDKFWSLHLGAVVTSMP
jgi:hypothetical protein